MQHRAFYESVLPVREDAIYILWEKASRRTFTYNGFEAFVEAAHKEGLGTDWYYAAAAFDAPKRKNEHVIALKSFRLDLDAGPDKYDPDSPEKAYESLDAAVSGLGEFVKATKLTPTHVVRSGHGLHVYFALDAEVGPDEWHPVARALQVVAVAHGLRADPAITSDKGRLLRPPGSTHYSGTKVRLLATPAKPYSFVGFAAMVDALTPDGGVIAAARPPVNKSRAKELLDDLDIEPAPYQSSFHKAATKCAVLSGALAAPEKMHHDTWFKVMVVAENSVEGRALAHEISAQDADRYDNNELDKRLDTFESDFITCAKFAESAPQCRSCAFFGKINGPKELGRLNTEEREERGLAAFTLPPDVEATDEDEVREKFDLPEDFPSNDEMEGFFVKWGKNGGRLYAIETRTRVNPATGEKEEFTTHRGLTDDLFYFPSWADAATGTMIGYTMKVRSRAGYWVEHPLRGDMVVDRKAMIGFLSSFGVHPLDNNPKTFDALQNFTMNLLNRVKNQMQRPAARERLGFQFMGRGRPVYVQGLYAVNEEGELVRALSTALVRSAPKDLTVPALDVFDGDFPEDVWDRIHAGARTFTRALRTTFAGKPLQQATLLMGMASSMLPFVSTDKPKPHSGGMPEVGALISLYSAATGAGKSTLQTIIGMAYYDPHSFKMSGGVKVGGSIKAMMGTAAALGCLPLILDEVTNNEPEVVTNVVYQIPNGKDTIRLKQNGDRTEARGWSLIGTMSTNMSQRDMLQAFRSTGVAGQARVLELNFDGQEKPTRDEREAFRLAMSRELMPNTGLLGLAIAREVMLLGYEKMCELGDAAVASISEKFELSTDERYYAQIGAATSLLHLILTRLNMRFYDFSLVMREFGEAVGQSRQFISDNVYGDSDILSELLREFSPNMYLSENELDLRGRGDRKPELPLITPRGPAVGRFVQNGRYAYLATDAIRQWCRERGTSITTVERSAAAKGLLYTTADSTGRQTPRHTVLLTKGLRDVPPLRAICWKVNLAALNFDVSTEGIENNVVPLTRPAEGDNESKEQRDANPKR